MRQYTFPARYARVVESALAIALAEVRCDARRRDDDDAVVRALAPIPDALLDLDEPGECVILVTIPNLGARAIAESLDQDAARVLATAGA